MASLALSAASEMAPLMLVAGVLELVGGALLIVGFLTARRLSFSAA